MKYRKNVIEQIRKKASIKLAMEFKVSQSTVYKWARTNAPNGPLTRKRAIDIIVEATGLRECELLESVAQS